MFIVVEGVVGLTKVFRRDVIAEGVETATHGMLLMSLQCELAQGYAIARPMPPERLPEWVAQWQPFESWRTQAHVFSTPERAPYFVLEMELQHWLQTLQTCARQPLSDAHWPLHTGKNCHLGRWIVQARRAGTVHSDWLDRLEARHEKLCQLVETLRAQTQQPAPDQAAATLAEIEQITNIILDMLRNGPVWRSGLNS